MDTFDASSRPSKQSAGNSSDSAATAPEETTVPTASASSTAADTAAPEPKDDSLDHLPSFLRHPSKRDIWLYVALMALTIYSFAILPFRAALMVEQPVLYTVLTGSSLTLVTHGANNPTDYGFLAAMILISVISAMKFFPIYYLVGRWWGEEFIDLSFNNRQPLWWRKMENFIRIHTGWSLFFCYIPFSPIPATIVVILAAVKQVRWWVVAAYLFVFVLAVKILYTYLGIAFDEQVIASLRVIDRYLMWITLALVIWTIFLAQRKPKTPKPTV